jgi:cellulose synthase (UDP-forming)
LGEKLPQGLVLQDSEIDLSGVAHFARMPNLELFAKAGFPYTRVPDLSETAVVLPAAPTAEQIAVYLGAMGFFGSQTGMPGIRVSVVQPDEAPNVRGKDLLVIGTGEDQPLFSRLGEQMPIRVDGLEPKLRDLTNPFQALRAKLPSHLAGERRQLHDLLLTESPEAVVQGLGSPFEAHRSVVALWTPSSRDTAALVSLFDHSLPDDEVFGAVSLHSNSRYQSFRPTLDSYEVGTLAWREALDYWAARYLLLLPLLIVGLLYLAAIRIHRWLDEKAEDRLAPAGAELHPATD